MPGTGSGEEPNDYGQTLLRDLRNGLNRAELRGARDAYSLVVPWCLGSIAVGVFQGRGVNGAVASIAFFSAVTAIWKHLKIRGLR